MTLACVLVVLPCFLLPPEFSPDRDVIFVPPLLAAAVFTFFMLPERGREIGLLAFLIIAFSSIMMGRWHAGLSGGEVIAGRIAFSDASGYLHDASMLLDGTPLSSFSSRRPIYALMLAAFMKVGGGSFTVASVFILVFTAIALTAFATTVERTHGRWAAAALTLLLMLFYRRFVGTALTEHAGLAFGCLAATLLWRGAETRSSWELCGGLFLLTIALVARAGCFFVLPALAIWIGWISRHRRWLNWRAFGMACLAIIGGFMLNSALVHIFGSPGVLFSNFPVTLYGLISGGDWMSFYHDYPDIGALPDAELAPKVVAIVIERLRQNPWLLAAGMVRAWRNFISIDGGQFDFIHLHSSTPESITAYLSSALEHAPASVAEAGRLAHFTFWPSMARHLLYGIVPWTLFALGGIVMLRKLDDRRHSLIAMTWIGMIASIPFNPSWDSNSMRTYAATLPLQMLLVAIGTSTVAGVVAARLRRPALTPLGNTVFSPVAGLGIATAILPVLLIIWASASRPAVAVPSHRCSTGRPHLAQAVKGTRVAISDKPIGLLSLTPAQLDDGFAGLPDTYSALHASFRALPTGTILLFANVLDSGGLNIVAVHSDAAARAFEQAPQPICISGADLLADTGVAQEAK